jgi:endo-1,4-beta-xylanase
MGRTDYPLLYNRNYQPKPVVARIIEAAMKK